MLGETSYTTMYIVQKYPILMSSITSIIYNNINQVSKIKIFLELSIFNRLCIINQISNISILLFANFLEDGKSVKNPRKTTINQFCTGQKRKDFFPRLTREV